MKIKAAITRETGKIEIETLELAAPKAGEVLVKVVACGVCHTDASSIKQFIPARLPMVMGHEGVGIIEEIGDGVSGLAVGDHVVLSFPSCGTCPACADGKPYACKDMKQLFFGGDYTDGTTRITDANGEAVSSLFGQSSFADHCIVEARHAVKVDPEVDLKALCSLGCGVQTGAGAVLCRMKPEPGSSIAIFGAGAVGLSAVMAAKIAGCSKIIVVDLVDARLELAKEMGATHVLNGKACDVPATIMEITNGLGVNYGLEAVGVPVLVQQMLQVLGGEGLGVLVGVTGDAQIPVHANDLMDKNASFTGAIEGGANPKTFIPKLVQFYKEGRLPIDLMSKYYAFDDIEKAFEDSHTGEVIKPILVF